MPPTQETIFKINEKALVGCKATDGYTVEDGKIKNTRSMLDEKRETKRVEKWKTYDEIEGFIDHVNKNEWKDYIRKFVIPL